MSVSLFTCHEFRQRMKVSRSNMEAKVGLALADSGLYPMFDEKFCLLSTTPDFYFPEQRIAVYLDGAVHKGREDRDSRLRELLTKRHGIQVVGISYKGTRKCECDRVLNVIMEALK